MHPAVLAFCASWSHLRRALTSLIDFGNAFVAKYQNEVEKIKDR